MNRNELSIIRYYNKLLDYCKIIGISVFEEKGGSVYIQVDTKEIFINSSHKTLLQISSILHELGHYVDDLETKGAYDKDYVKGIRKIEAGKKLNQKEFDAVMRCEVKAWEKGQIIAKQLSIPLGKWFHKDKERCLIAYYNAQVLKNVVK